MNKYKDILLRYIKPEQATLTDEEYLEKELCEKSLYEFGKRAWAITEGVPFKDGWHAQAVSEHLEALYWLEITDLLINQPPRTGKSSFGAVFFPAWGFLHDPAQSFLYTSYSQWFSGRDSMKCRRLIQSPWYQKYWGHKVNLRFDAKNKLYFETTSSGYRIASSVDGGNTGGGANFICTDDPNNIKEIFSEVTRMNTNEWWDSVMPTRYRLLSERRRLVIQQRTHVDDLSGHILAKDDSKWVHLCLPMEFEKNRRCITIPLKSTNGKRWHDPRKRDGELLWPQGVTAKDLEKLKEDFNYDEYIIAGQLQQLPAPDGGGILKREWFQWWKEKELPNFETIVQSWDTALTAGVDSCFSACTTWGIFKDDGGIYNLMLLSLFSEKVEYPDLRKMAVRLSNNYKDTDIDDQDYGRNPVDLILIEAKVSGYSLLQDLMAANLPVMRFNPNKHGDKIGRARLVSHLMQNGLVWLPTKAPKCEYLTQESQMFLQAASLFPNDTSNDIIDSMSQAMIYIKNAGWLVNKEDPPMPVQEAWATQKPYY